MVQLFEEIYIPHIGAYRTGDHADLGPELEKQLIAAGKAIRVDDTEAEVVTIKKG